MTLSTLYSDCTELPDDLDGMDTKTLRKLRDSQHTLLTMATAALLNGMDGARETVREIGARIRRINKALDFKDGMEADR